MYFVVADPKAQCTQYVFCLSSTELQCSDTPIEGKAGGRVILPCSTKDNMDISHKQVEWLYKDSNTGKCKDVHFYHQGENYLQEQSDDFKNQLSSGNCSLSLLVTTAHGGTYNCSVAGNLPCTVTLKGTY